MEPAVRRCSAGLELVQGDSEADDSECCVAGGVVSILGILLSNFLALQRSLRHCQAARPRWAAEFQGCAWS